MRFFREKTSGEKIIRAENKHGFSRHTEDAPLFENQQEINSNSGGIFTINIIIVLAVLGIIYGGIAYDKIKHKYFANKHTDSTAATSASDSSNKDTIVKNEPVKPLLPTIPDRIYGIWKGEAEGKKITVVIEKIDSALIKGCSCVDGYSSLFFGKIIPKDTEFIIALNESQNDGFYGIYHLAYNISQKHISGKWESYNGDQWFYPDLTHAENGDIAKVIADTAYCYEGPEYNKRYWQFLLKDDSMVFDSLSQWYIHCAYYKNGEDKTAWFNISNVAFK